MDDKEQLENACGEVIQGAFRLGLLGDTEQTRCVMYCANVLRTCLKRVAANESLAEKAGG